MKIVKKLEDYPCKEIIDMKRAQFEEALEVSEMNLGQLESMRKFFSLQYEVMKKQIEALSKLLAEGTITSEEQEKAEETIQQLFLIMFSLEYKATLLYKRAQEIQGKS